jgi:CrcB protein
MLSVLAIALGGAFGALARYGVDRLLEHHIVTVFPWSTFTINATGCLLIGIVIGAGAYTTFSAFAQKTLGLAEGAHLGVALAYRVGSISAGVGAVALGLAFGRST